jgi:hypothetical protein
MLRVQPQAVWGPLVLCAFVFLALFGFADEARQHYRRVYRASMCYEKAGFCGIINPLGDINEFADL